MKKLIIIAILFIGISCTDAAKAKIDGYGHDYTIELVNCDGTITHKWTSSGKVSSSHQSDGYYFMDKSSGQLKEVSGTLIITRL